MRDEQEHDDLRQEGLSRAPAVVLAELATPVDATPVAVAPARRRRRAWLPLILFMATCVSTTLVGGMDKAEYVLRDLYGQVPLHYAALEALGAGLIAGLWFSVPLMVILSCHELGHFLQARRHGVHCSFPFFIPVPLPPLGTMGAVIAMDPRVPHRKALFDIGVSGPLAGLVPTMIFLIVGLHWSHLGVIIPTAPRFGDPLVFQWLTEWILGPVRPGLEVYVHPMAFAGWAGLLLTTINLFPLGQLDGGHIFYSLLGRRANNVVRVLFLVLIAAMVLYWKYVFSYTLLIILLALMRPTHPPTANDGQPLGLWRTVLGWLTLAFIPLGFTPTPIIVP